MKKIALILLFVPLFAMAQKGKICNEKYLEKNVVSKIKNYKYYNLLPYFDSSSNKWGLFDKETGVKLVKPIFGNAQTFSPDFVIEQCRMEISSDYEVSSLRYEEYMAYSPERTNKKGFTTRESGFILSYHREYNEISDYAFPYKGNYYAVVRVDKQYFIVDQEGAQQLGLFFKKINNYIYDVNGEPWFFYQDFDDNYGFINLAGEQKYHGEIGNLFNTKLGYSIQNDMKDNNPATISKSGILDLATLEWFIAPQSEYQIYDCLYTSGELIPFYAVYKYKERASAKEIYFVVRTKDGKQLLMNTEKQWVAPKMEGKK